MEVVERVIVKYYCQTNQYDSQTIIRRVRNFLKSDHANDMTIYDVLERVIKKFLEDQEIKKIKHNFDRLVNATTNEEYKLICENLKINWNHVKKLSYQGYDKKQIINYIWYFHDKNVNGYKDISKKRLYEIKNKKLLESNEIYYFIGFYKCGYKNYIEQIFNYEDKYLKIASNKVAKLFDLSFDKKEELYLESRLILMKLLQKVVLNDIRRIITYMNIRIRGGLIDYAKKNYNKTIEFNEKYLYREVV